MRIECPGCQAEYHLDEKKIPATGATVPCRKCKAKISVKPPSKEVTSEVSDQTITKSTQSFTENLKSQASGFTDKAVDYGEKIRIKANNLKSKLDEKKNNGQSVDLSGNGIKSRVNTFLFFSFKVGKIISTVSLVLFFFVFTGSVVYYFVNQMHSFSPPDFEQARSYLENKSQNSAKPEKYTFAGVDEKRKVQDKYDKVIRKIISSHGLVEEAYEAYLNILTDYEEPYRDDYIYGLEKYLQSWSELKKQKQNAPDFKTVINLYFSMFSEKVKAAELSKQQAAAKNYLILGVIGASLVLYILFLLVPLMIKIEENTRPLAAGADKNRRLQESQSEDLSSAEVASNEFRRRIPTPTVSKGLPKNVPHH